MDGRISNKHLSLSSALESYLPQVSHAILRKVVFRELETLFRLSDGNQAGGGQSILIKE